MAKTRTLRSTAVVVLLAMLAVACGQKEGVHDVGFAGGQTGDGQTGTVDDGTVADGGDADGFDDPGTDADSGDGTDPGTGTTGGGADPGTGTTGGGGGGTGGGGGGGGGTGGGGGDGTGGGGGGGGGEPGDTTGITDTTIKIGLHAPLSGAAPLPQQSFNSGKDLYWNHIGELYGRQVEVVIRDDQYNPSRATSVCNDLIQREQVYLLIGGGGTDQISACARTAAQQGVPYLSAGVDEGALRALNNYFALSMSYLQQADLLIQWVAKNSPPPNGKFGIVRDRTPGFNNVVEKVRGLAQQQGWDVLVRQTQNGPSDASWLTQNQIQVAFPIMSPSTWVQIVRSPGGDIDQWAGVGITMGLNTVATAGCPNIDGAMFFSPAPGLNIIDSIDPEFRQAGGEDDIELLLWGLSRAIHEVFKKMPESNLSRQNFARALETNVIDSKVYPVLRHSPDNHFGAQDVHVLIADCSRGEYVTRDDGVHRSSF